MIGLSPLVPALLLIVLAVPAQAHGTLPGGGGFHSGALHSLVAPEHLLALLAGGLILGRGVFATALRDGKVLLWLGSAASAAAGVFWISVALGRL